MASEIEICNIALSHIGGFPIQSFEEDLKEAQECKRLYAQTRDEVLEAHDWDFARKHLALALLADTYTGWTYAYGYPTDCLIARYIETGSGTAGATAYDVYSQDYVSVNKIRYEVIINAALDQRVILTNQESAELVYTARVEIPDLFSTLFRKVLAQKLAYYLANPVRGDATIQKDMLQQYLLVINEARASNANQSHVPPNDRGSILSSRD